MPLLSLILERRGFPGSVNGLNLATAGLAAILITPQVPRMIRRFGTTAYLIGSLTLSAGALLALYAAPDLWLWFPMRFLLSVGLNGLFVASEFWINQLADESNRGRYVALYGIAISGASAWGRPSFRSWGRRESHHSRSARPCCCWPSCRSTWPAKRRRRSTSGRAPA